MYKGALPLGVRSKIGGQRYKVKSRVGVRVWEGDVERAE